MRDAEKAEKLLEQIVQERKAGNKVSKPNTFVSGSANIRKQPKPITQDGRRVTLV